MGRQTKHCSPRCLSPPIYQRNAQGILSPFLMVGLPLFLLSLANKLSLQNPIVLHMYYFKILEALVILQTTASHYGYLLY